MFNSVTVRCHENFDSIIINNNNNNNNNNNDDGDYDDNNNNNNKIQPKLVKVLFSSFIAMKLFR